MQSPQPRSVQAPRLAILTCTMHATGASETENQLAGFSAEQKESERLPRQVS